MPYIPGPPSDRWRRIVEEPGAYFAEARARAEKELSEQRLWERKKFGMSIWCRFNWHDWTSWKAHRWTAVNNVTYIGQKTSCRRCSIEKIRTVGPR